MPELDSDTIRGTTEESGREFVQIWRHWERDPRFLTRPPDRGFDLTSANKGLPWRE